MKSLFASLEPGECRRVEEEFEKLTNESAVDVIDPDAKLEEILAVNISTAKAKVWNWFSRLPNGLATSRNTARLDKFEFTEIFALKSALNIRKKLIWFGF